jgi:hypothetical protein
VSVDVSNAGTIPTLSTGQTAAVTGTYSNDVLLADRVSIVQPLSAEHAFEVSHDDHSDHH